MNKRVTRLREQSFKAQPCISTERALLVTEFYKENVGKYSVPVLRALNFKNLCEQKTIYIGDDELIVGERGPFAKSVSTFPELTCHSLEDFKILDSREMTRYAISDETLKIYQKVVIPYWNGRTMRERVFSQVPAKWKLAYEAGIFTEFMEQRAAGHTTLDGVIYCKGMLDFKAEIADSLAGLDYLNDSAAADKAEELKAMDICCPHLQQTHPHLEGQKKIIFANCAYLIQHRRKRFYHRFGISKWLQILPRKAYQS